MWYLYIALAKTGALDKFASGREGARPLNLTHGAGRNARAVSVV